jgi:hypothetical protein
MSKVITPSPQQEASLLWAIERTLEDQEAYLKTGNPIEDHGEAEWPEAAGVKAEQLVNLAEVCEQINAVAMADDCRQLAAAYMRSVGGEE